MAFLKSCCCPGCKKEADISDIAEEDQLSAVVCCDDCEGLCDPFADDAVCLADHNQHPRGARFPHECDACYAAEEADEEARVCPSCHGPGRELGALGNTMHYRCRNCGRDWSISKL